jgi:hypothetical protein
MKTITRTRIYLPMAEMIAKKGKTMKQKSSSTRVRMKQLATAALMLNFGITGMYAQQGPVNMTVSGSTVSSTIDLQPGRPASEYQLAGTGALGQFTLRVVSASAAAPQLSSTCSGPTKIYFPTVAGAAVFRFDDGGLLKVNLTGGSDCIDFAAGQAFCTRVFQVTGGTGRFQNASSGTITLTMTVVPVLANASNSPVFFSVTGAVTGAVPGVALDDSQARNE